MSNTSIEDQMPPTQPIDEFEDTMSVEVPDKPKLKRQRGVHHTTTKGYTKKPKFNSGELKKRKVTILEELIKSIESYGDVLDEKQKELFSKVVIRFKDDYRSRQEDKAQELTLPFGRFFGKTIKDVWDMVEGKKSGRSYLQWIVTQEWLFDDIKEAIKALQSSFLATPKS